MSEGGRGGKEGERKEERDRRRCSHQPSSFSTISVTASGLMSRPMKLSTSNWGRERERIAESSETKETLPPVHSSGLALPE